MHMYINNNICITQSGMYHVYTSNVHMEHDSSSFIITALIISSTQGEMSEIIYEHPADC